MPVGRQGFAPLIIIIVLTTISIFGIIYYKNRDVLQVNNLTSIQTVPDFTTSPIFVVPDVTIKFDITKQKIGSRVGTMTINKLRFTDSEHWSVDFSGQVAVTGNLSAPGGIMGDEICMDNFDEKKSLALLPKAIQDGRDVWFCFKNKEIAKTFVTNDNILRATVIFDNYTETYIPALVFNTATLVSFV